MQTVLMLVLVVARFELLLLRRRAVLSQLARVLAIGAAWSAVQRAGRGHVLLAVAVAQHVEALLAVAVVVVQLVQPLAVHAARRHVRRAPAHGRLSRSIRGCCARVRGELHAEAGSGRGRVPVRGVRVRQQLELAQLRLDADERPLVATEDL